MVVSINTLIGLSPLKATSSSRADESFAYGGVKATGARLGVNVRPIANIDIAINGTSIAVA